MKVCIVFAAILAIAAAASVSSPKDATILRYDVDNIGVEGYKFEFESSDGIQRSEEAVLKNVGTEQESLAVRGTINWVDLEGKQYTMSFVADENGFQPVGDHIPK